MSLDVTNYVAFEKAAGVGERLKVARSPRSSFQEPLRMLVQGNGGAGLQEPLVAKVLLGNLYDRW